MFPERLRRLYGAGEEHLGAEAAGTPGGCPHKDIEVAVDAQQPLYGLRHVQVGQPGLHLQVEEPGNYYRSANSHTDKKENQNFLLYKEILNGAVAKSYMTNGLLIYG